MTTTQLTPPESANESGPPPTTRRVATLIVAIPAVLLTVTAILRWVFGHASIDLVVFDQALWAASRGMNPLSSVIGENLLEDHFAPGLLSFAVLYRIVASPIWLLVGQGLAAWVAVRLVVRRLEPALGSIRAAGVGAALLVSPPVAYALLFDVHSVVFAVPFGLAGLLALEDGRPRRALLFGLLACLFRVDVGLAVAVAFVVWPGSRRGRLRPAVVLWAYLAFAFYFEKALGHDVYWSIHYGYLGESTGAAIRHPGRVLRALLSLDSISKALPWLATGAFLAVRSPRRAIPAIAIALPVLLSSWPGTDSVMSQYGFAPSLLLAAAWIPSLVSKPGRATYVIGACAFLAVLFGPVAPAIASNAPLRHFGGQYWVPDNEARCIGSGIPADAGVSAARPITLLAHRERLYLWPYPFGGVPGDILPAEYLSHGAPLLVAGVDYILMPRKNAALVPAGFVPDGESRHYLRFRREAATAPRPRDCG